MESTNLIIGNFTFFIGTHEIRMFKYLSTGYYTLLGVRGLPVPWLEVWLPMVFSWIVIPGAIELFIRTRRS